MKRPTADELVDAITATVKCDGISRGNLTFWRADTMYFSFLKDNMPTILTLFSTDTGIICRQAGTDNRRNKLFKYSDYSCLIEIVQDAIAYGCTTNTSPFVAVTPNNSGFVAGAMNTTVSPRTRKKQLTFRERNGVVYY